MNSFLERIGPIHETADFERMDNMNPAALLALTVKELEPGEFHWILLEGESDDYPKLLLVSKARDLQPHEIV